jgi:hypothetical protein
MKEVCVLKKALTCGGILMLSAMAVIPMDMAAAADTNQTQSLDPGAAAGVVTHAEVHEPPKGWNPLTAPPEELNYYNYPPRPTDAEHLAKWKEIVSTARWTKATFSKGNSVHKSLGATTNSSVQMANRWDGVVSDNQYTRVVGYWKQPVNSSDSSHLPAYQTQWIGLGGYGVTPLIQMGTNSGANADSTGNYNVWYEICGTNKETRDSYGTPVGVTINLKHNAGDQFYGDIWWTVDSNGYGTAHFYIEDQTVGSTFTFDVTGITNYSGVDTSAEWIIERPGAYGNYYFGKTANVPFTCSAGQASGPLAHPDPYASSTVYSQLQDPNTLSKIGGCTTLDYNGYFQATWLGYGTYSGRW